MTEISLKKAILGAHDDHEGSVTVSKMSVAVDTKNTQCERLSYHNFFIPYGFGVPSVRALLTDILLTSLIQFVQDTESNYSK